MGQRSAGKTIASIFGAFLRQRTWTQSSLAHECGVGVKALRARLLELSESGVPLESETDHPHVYWSVPRSWFPDATLLSPAQVAMTARLLLRLPASQQRAEVLQALLVHDDSSGSEPAVDTTFSRVLTVLEDGMRERRAVHIDYYAVSRGDRERREISVHRILYGERVRVLATCHRTDTFKYFRVDCVRDASFGAHTAYRAANAADIDTFLATSTDGYRTADSAAKYSFVVRYPDARWVRGNYPPCAMEAAPVEHGIRFTAHVAGVEPLARFVVGLGAAARAETPELARRVSAIARGALGEIKPLRKVNTRSVRPKRAAQ